VTLPVVVILALLLGHPGTHEKTSADRSGTAPTLAPLTPAAPPSDASTQGPCTKLLTTLPVQLGELVPRVVHPKPDSPFVIAWGNPAVLLRCGVERPSNLKPGSADFVPQVDGVAFFEKDTPGAYVYTTIDRAAYVEVSVPSSLGAGPLPQLRPRPVRRSPIRGRCAPTASSPACRASFPRWESVSGRVTGH
jgi:hypothetical protein